MSLTIKLPIKKKKKKRKKIGRKKIENNKKKFIKKIKIFLKIKWKKYT